LLAVELELRGLKFHIPLEQIVRNVDEKRDDWNFPGALYLR